MKPDPEAPARVSGGTEGAGGEASGAREVEVVAAAERLQLEDPPFLLDVREPWEWAVSNLSDLGARLIPLSELDDRLGEIPMDRAIVVYCKSGQRSRTAALRIAGSGRSEVESLRGGLVAWAAAVDPDLRVV